jgi:hypothetical protein
MPFCTKHLIRVEPHTRCVVSSIGCVGQITYSHSCKQFDEKSDISEEHKMSRYFSRSLVILLALVLFGLSGVGSAQEQFVNARGNWTIYSRNIDNGAMVTKHVQITQDGNQLWGHFEGPNQSGPIRGFVNGRHIEFSTKTRNVLTFRGQLDGNQISGNYGLHGRHAEFTAVRE